MGGLAPEVGEKEFSDYFSKFGAIQDSIVMYDRKTNRSRGFGFVTFDNEETIQNVLRMEHEIMGKWVEIKRAEPREPSKAMGGMGGRMDGRGDPRNRGRGYDDYYGGGGYMHPMHGQQHMGGRGPVGGHGAGYGYPPVRYGDGSAEYGSGGVGAVGRGGGYGGAYGYPSQGMGGYFGGGGGAYPAYGYDNIYFTYILYCTNYSI